jgi:hypothetical protein
MRELSASHTGQARQPQSPMTEELVALLRDRVTTRFYDQPQVVDAVARSILHQAKDLIAG